MHRLRPALIVIALLASTVHADQEKVGRRPPHYLGKAPATAVSVVRGPVLTGRSFIEPGPAKELIERLEAARPGFEATLDSLVAAVPAALEAGGFADGAPAVYVGSPEGFYSPGRLDGSDGADLARDAMLIRTVDPTGAWKKRMRAVADGAGVTHILVVALELSDYPVSQKNWKGSKAVDLAAGHTMAVPWLTSLDQPVEVLQWTGSLYTANGKLVRAGAEAFHALRTPFLESGMGLQRATTADVLEKALASTRDDLPGGAPAWRVALEKLVGELMGVPRGRATP